MPGLARTSLLALVLALPACSDSSGPDRLTIYDCDQGMRYSVGRTVSGAVTSSDCGDPGGRDLMDYYQLRLSSSGPVSLVVARSGGSSMMYVKIIGAGGVGVDFAEIDPGGQVAVGGQLDAGTYIIVIGGRVPGQNSYTLSSSATLPPTGAPFYNCTVVQAYTLGNTVSGTLGTGDCLTPGQAWMDRHQFTLASTRTVTIDLSSSDFDAFLYLFNDAGTVIARNDDNTFNLDSRLSLSLPAGTYSIGASAFGVGEEGSYTLRVQ